MSIDKNREIEALDTAIQRVVKMNYVNVPQYSNYGGFEYHKAYYTSEIARELYEQGYRKQSEGEWVKGSIGNTRSCSLCGETVTFRNNYCPNCGAKMKGEDNG